MYPMARLIVVTGAPSYVTAPADGFSVPATRFSSVDLPQPLGPTIARNSPLRTSRFAGPMACIPPKCTFTSWNWISTGRGTPGEGEGTGIRLLSAAAIVADMSVLRRFARHRRLHRGTLRERLVP